MSVSQKFEGLLSEICEKNGVDYKILIDKRGFTCIRFFKPYIITPIQSTLTFSTGYGGTLYDVIKHIKGHFIRNLLSTKNFDWSYYMKKSIYKSRFKEWRCC